MSFVSYHARTYYSQSNGENLQAMNTGADRYLMEGSDNDSYYSIGSFVDLEVIVPASPVARGGGILVKVVIVNNTPCKIAIRETLLRAAAGKVSAVTRLPELSDRRFDPPCVDWSSGRFMKQTICIEEIVCVPAWIPIGSEDTQTNGHETRATQSVVSDGNVDNLDQRWSSTTTLIDLEAQSSNYEADLFEEKTIFAGNGLSDHSVPTLSVGHSDPAAYGEFLESGLSVPRPVSGSPENLSDACNQAIVEIEPFKEGEGLDYPKDDTALDTGMCNAAADFPTSSRQKRRSSLFSIFSAPETAMGIDDETDSAYEYEMPVIGRERSISSSSIWSEKASLARSAVMESGPSNAWDWLSVTNVVNKHNTPVRYSLIVKIEPVKRHRRRRADAELLGSTGLLELEVPIELCDST